MTRRITVFTIATGKYWQYFLDLFNSIDEAKFTYLEFLVLTDGDIQSKRNLLDKRKVRIFQAHFTSWPEVTLFRYSEILRLAPKIDSEVLIWLDTDMELVRLPDIHTLEKTILFARHPGFEITLKSLLSMSWKDGLFRFQSLLVRLLSGQRFPGAWDEEPSSFAFVPPKSRRRYVHGAVWGGPTQQILNMCTELSDRIASDLRNHYIPPWHDESYLNWYCSKHKTPYFPKYFSGTRGFPNSRPDLATVISLNKLQYEVNNFEKFKKFDP